MAYEDMPNGFHDTGLVAATQEGQLLRLKVQYLADDEDETGSYVEAVVSGIEKLFRDDAEIQRFEMETEYGFIVALESRGNDVIALVRWFCFDSRGDFYAFYSMQGANVKLTVDGQAIDAG